MAVAWRGVEADARAVFPRLTNSTRRPAVPHRRRHAVGVSAENLGAAEPAVHIDAFRSHGGLYNPVPLPNAKRSTDLHDRALVIVAVTGANSGAGRILVRHLADRSDARVVACVRARRSAASLPSSERVSVQVIDYDDPDGLASRITGSTCVVHLAGILFESPSSSYQTANVAATQAVTRACKAAGAAHLVLVSALGADPGSTNPYLRSKGEAERIVTDSGLTARIIRTPILLGPGMAGARAVVHSASSSADTRRDGAGVERRRSPASGRSCGSWRAY